MRSEYVSGNYFSTLGVGPYAGRLLNENDDTPGAAPTLVLSYKTWQSDFAADHAIVGSTVYVETHPFVVAGIAPPGFRVLLTQSFNWSSFHDQSGPKRGISILIY
jgi:macrolide transport system ATP-binding/permease protein